MHRPRRKGELLPEKFTYRGRVVGPDGKPVKDAQVFLQVGSPTPQPLVPRAKTDAEGRFSFEVKRSEFDFRSYEFSPMPWRWGHLIASAPNLGVAWTEELAPEKDAELQLSADDAPIEGRILNLQGEAVPGAKVHVLWALAGEVRRPRQVAARNSRGSNSRKGWPRLQGLQGLMDTTLRHATDWPRPFLRRLRARTGGSR